MLKTSAVLTYTNSNAVARKNFSFRNKAITKHGEMRNLPMQSNLLLGSAHKGCPILG
jgi:hypothetical protein